MGNRNQTIDALRGLAALSVCLFHFTNGQHFSEVSLLWSVTSHGRLGVEAFFVISGFVVPYAMVRSGYSLADWHVFMTKRLIRLEPPYLASIVIMMALGIASTFSPDFRGPPINWSAAQLAAYLGYANALVGYSWHNPVYWTLAIEFQFYLLVGLALPAFLNTRPWVRFAIVCAFAAAPLVDTFGDIFLPSHLSVFAAGLWTFLCHRSP